MRALAFAVAVLALATGPVSAEDPFVTLVPPSRGHFLAGAPTSVEGVNAARFAFAADACHRRLHVDLDFAPDGVRVGVPDAASLGVRYAFRVEVRDAQGVVAGVDVDEPSRGVLLGDVPSAGGFDLVVRLARGADVAWETRLVGAAVPGDPACGPLPG